jgi:predicted ATPase
VLKRLYIDNVRSFSNFTLEPGRVAALVGPNGGGKSSVLRVLGALQEFLVLGHEANQVFGGSRTRWDNRLEQRIELDVLVNNQTNYSYVLTVSDSGYTCGARTNTRSSSLESCSPVSGLV